MLDDETREPLVQRADDTEEALSKRLTSYHGQTVPILQHYMPAGIVKKIDGNQSIDTIRSDIDAVIQPWVALAPPREPAEHAEPAWKQTFWMHMVALDAHRYAPPG